MAYEYEGCETPIGLIYRELITPPHLDAVLVLALHPLSHPFCDSDIFSSLALNICCQLIWIQITVIASVPFSYCSLKPMHFPG